jgi:hypothetical protein
MDRYDWDQLPEVRRKTIIESIKQLVRNGKDIYSNVLDTGLYNGEEGCIGGGH